MLIFLGLCHLLVGGTGRYKAIHLTYEHTYKHMYADMCVYRYILNTNISVAIYLFVCMYRLYILSYIVYSSILVFLSYLSSFLFFLIIQNPMPATNYLLVCSV